jgi:hypothetical protein
MFDAAALPAVLSKKMDEGAFSQPSFLDVSAVEFAGVQTSVPILEVRHARGRPAFASCCLRWDKPPPHGRHTTTGGSMGGS